MRCLKCKTALKKVEVSVYGSKNKAISYQCANCNYFEFDPTSSREVVKELK